MGKGCGGVHVLSRILGVAMGMAQKSETALENKPKKAKIVKEKMGDTVVEELPRSATTEDQGSTHNPNLGLMATMKRTSRRERSLSMTPRRH
ncbi:hypothetical protein CK203_040199 [Vitis vinifera]|uniref:Uncharacterized protein n=1 Tax=Vitis vinifera TaxID=29760 RepID=A0A438H3Y5_VITVI|nr:hypothetical protein CK203_040199 [Vitis vinifera]